MTAPLALPALAAEPATLLRDLLAGEQFGVLATASDDRLHTSTILFAATETLELVFAIRPATLKAYLASRRPYSAFQVDNRAVTADDRAAFTRAGFDGSLRRVNRDDPAWSAYHDVFTAKFAFGATLLESPEIELYVLTAERVRFARGAQTATDYAIPAPPVALQDGSAQSDGDGDGDGVSSSPVER